MIARLRHNLRTALASATAFVCFVTPTPTLANDPQIGAVRVGFTGAPVEERWFPLRVTITPGDEPVQALLTVEVQQDAASPARVAVPVASAPGQVSVVTVPVCMARHAREINLSLTTARGRELHTRTLMCTFNPANPDEMHDALPPETPVVASLLGQAGPGSAIVAAAFPQLLATVTGHALTNTTDSTLTPADLPDSWLCYQGASVLLVRAADALRLDERRLSAVRQWVLFGGRLIIIADAPGADWQRWLPPVDQGLLTLSDATRDGDWPGALRDRVQGGALLFDGAQRRWITRTARAEAQGWSLLSPRDDGAGLIAVGPVGLGLVTIVGFDPSVTVVPGAPDALRAVWTHILTEPHGSWAWMGVGNTARNPYLRIGSGETEVAARALRDAMDATVDVPPVSGSLVFWLGVILLALALMLGPGDRFILGRLGLRHRSWMSGPLWIVLGGALMLILPDLARSTQTTASRFEVIDVLCPPPEGAPALAFTTDVRAAFAAATTEARWPGLPDGAFVRAVSALGRDAARGDALARAGSLPLTLLATGAQGGDGDPFGGFGPSGGGGASCVPAQSATIRRWSLRAIMAQARVQAPLSAVALQTGSGRVVRITGLSPDAEIIGSAVQVARARLAARARHAEGQGGAVEVPLDVSSATGTGRWWNHAGRDFALLDALESLPGARARDGSIDLRLDPGRYALVLLAVRHAQPAEAMTGAARTSHITLYRLLVPIGAPAAHDAGRQETGS